ncbi:MAG: hypothetical protein IKI59_04620 [Clostridia bacterium]|nr:hypothetical protein [Clostridia bacterium]
MQRSAMKPGGSTATWEIVKNIILAVVIVLCAFLEFLVIRKFLKGLKAKKA